MCDTIKFFHHKKNKNISLWDPRGWGQARGSGGGRGSGRGGRRGRGGGSITSENEPENPQHPPCTSQPTQPAVNPSK